MESIYHKTIRDGPGTTHNSGHPSSRFESPEKSHIKAIHEVLNEYDFLKGRMEIHMPFARAKPVLSAEKAWVWPKFDKRPTAYLIFLEGWPPCLWSPDRQEGATFKWILPASLTNYGPTIILANLLKGESVLQIEDLIIHNGKSLWTTKPFSERWEDLQSVWATLPDKQPLLSFQPRIVRPWTLTEWGTNYDPSLSYIIQHNTANCPRWFWRDTVTPLAVKQYIAPTIKRFPGVPSQTIALCQPYKSALMLPDIYALSSQEGEDLGIAAVSGLDMSRVLRETVAHHPKGFPVEVAWSTEFNKFKIVRIMPDETTISPRNSFLASQQASNGK